LPLDQVDEILDVQQIAHLAPAATEPDVAQRAAEMVGEHPVGEDALVDLAHLPRARDHAAAIHRRANAVALPVLLDQQLGRQLGGSVQRPRATKWKGLGDAGRGCAGNRLLVRQLEPAGGLVQGEAAESGHRIHPAGGQEHHLGLVPAHRLQAVIGPEQVRLHEVVRGAVQPGEHRWLRGAFDHGLEWRQSEQIVELADVAVVESDPSFAQPGQVELAAPAAKVVEGDELPVRMARLEAERGARPDEPGAAGDENPHGRPVCRKRRFVRQLDSIAPRCAACRRS
jgi:hypothetical protein